MSPAFKEWQVITEALGAGGQIIILRKGGISEGRDGFQVDAKRFWLFPTQFHAQREKTKPAAAKWFPTTSSLAEAPATITLRYFADLISAPFLDNWSAVAALDPFHFWTEAAVREKFAWDEPPGLYAMMVRVHRLNEPLVLPLTPEMSGCKSWIGLPQVFSTLPSAPVLDDATFAQRVAELPLFSEAPGGISRPSAKP